MVHGCRASGLHALCQPKEGLLPSIDFRSEKNARAEALAVMTEKRTCQECGAELPANAPQGLCPRCLARMGLGLAPTVALHTSDFHLERTGTMIGRYKLLEQIGQGGFGVVFMAEQTEPIQRKVALKIIKAGMDTKEVVTRFEAERQTS